MNVKQERHDEAEINELAAKMIEAHKQQTAKQQQLQQQVPRIANQNTQGIGQTNILNYLTRKPNATASTMPAAPNSLSSINSNLIAANQKTGVENENGNSNSSAEKKSSDEESIKGHFGWEIFPGKIYIPYIMRNAEKYCAVRMVEMKLLNKYLSYLHQDIYSCTCVRSYYITEAESRLFNEINTKHCDMQFGRDMFTLKDLVVRLADAYKFYQFLDVCYKKLLMGCSTPNDKCGFIRINKESVVPYTVREGQKMVPLFYFEGETENLKLKADYLSGWDLSYLKFCCKVQGIRNELFASDSVAVISLTDIKGYFPPGTEFEDYWPSKVVDSQLLSGPKSNNTIHWTRQPTQPPPKTAMVNNMPKASNQIRKTSAAMYNNLSQQSAIQKTTNSTIPNNITAAVQALTNNWNLANNLLTPAQQEQLLRMTQLQQQAQLRHVQNMSQNLNAHTYNQFMQSAMPMSSRTQQSQSNQAIPPPLVRSSQSQAAHMSANASMASYHQQQKRSNAISNGRGSSAMTQSVGHRTSSMQQDRLIAIPEMQIINAPYKAYEVTKQMIDNKAVICINKNPYATNNDLLMTLSDLKDTFFPYISLDVCRKVLSALDITLFKGNSLQYQSLQDAGKINIDGMPLVPVMDVMTFMPQLSYMVRGQIQETAGNKRARIS